MYPDLVGVVAGEPRVVAVVVDTLETDDPPFELKVTVKVFAVQLACRSRFPVSVTDF